MRFSPIAVAVAAAMLSLSAVAQDIKEQSQSGQSPAMSQEQKPSTEAQGSTSASGHNPEIIKQVQTRLNEQGHDIGQADGKMGPKTQKALKEFQTSKGMEATGQLDQQTLSALGVTESAAGGASKANKSEGSAGAGASTTEQKPQSPPAPPKSPSQSGEKQKY